MPRCDAPPEHCRARKGPALVHAHVIRPYSHSLSDDEKLYKCETERSAEAQRDPLPKFAVFLVREGILEESEIEALEAEVDRESDRSHRSRPGRRASVARIDLQMGLLAGCRSQPRVSSKPRRKKKAIRRRWWKWSPSRLLDEMKRDERIVVFGEDVADCSREESLTTVKGKGGVFKATAGLQRKFGAQRVFNSPLAEANIVGRSIGMAIRGLKPVPEIQFFDYIWPAMMQLRNELATMRWRSGGHFKSPVVIRVAIGGYLTGGAIYHSQCGEVTFTHIPGLRVVMPSTALDVCGLLRTAIRSDDPVLFLEHKHLYRQPYNRSEYPGPDFTIPFGKARMVREGTDVSIITYGAVVHRAEVAAAELSRDGISVEILDLRSLSPYDWECRCCDGRARRIAFWSLTKTRAPGDMARKSPPALRTNYSIELDAPVRRVAATDTFVAYQPKLEDEILPQTEDIVRAIRELTSY